jgi:hypothetical protein
MGQGEPPSAGPPPEEVALDLELELELDELDLWS